MGRRLTCCLGDFELLLKHIFLPPSTFSPSFDYNTNANVDANRVFGGLKLVHVAVNTAADVLHSFQRCNSSIMPPEAYSCGCIKGIFNPRVKLSAQLATSPQCEPAAGTLYYDVDCC